MKKTFSLLACLVCYIMVCAQLSEQQIDSVLKSFNQIKEDTSRADMYKKIGMSYMYKNPQKAEEFLIKAYNYPLPYSIKEQNIKMMAAGLLINVNAAKKDVQQKWINAAYSLLLKATDADAVEYTLEALSIYHNNSGRYDSSIFYGQKGIHLWDSLQKPENTIRGYFGIANTYQLMHLHEQALQNMRTVMSVGKMSETENNRYIVSVYRFFAQVHFALKQFDSSLYYIQRALPIAEKQGNTEGVIELLINKMFILVDTKKFAGIYPLATQSLALAKTVNYQNAFPQVSYALAYYFTNVKLKDSAMYYAQASQKGFENTVLDPETATRNYGMWSDVYAGFGDYKMAHLYKDSQLVALQKRYDTEVNQVALDKQTKYETVKKEEKITKLNQVTAQQRKIQWLIGAGLLLAIVAAAFAFNSYRNKKKTAEVLEQSNKEKEVFLKEIHHRVKNNLQIISSLLYMQFKDNKDEKMLAQLKQAQERIKSMALVHNKLYETSDVVHVYLKEYIADLATGILSSNTPAGKNISLHIAEEKPVSLSLDTSISLGLMLNELITNSCKYAFANKEQGNISISITQQSNNQYTLQVKDDGSGLPQDFEQRNSLGVRLIKNMARQLQGNVTFINNEGTTVKILFTDVIAA
jgi:two-component system, sensor histidine kinase PdtaS